MQIFWKILRNISEKYLRFGQFQIFSQNLNRLRRFFVIADGKTGWFPSNYVEDIQEQNANSTADKDIPGNETKIGGGAVKVSMIVYNSVPDPVHHGLPDPGKK